MRGEERRERDFSSSLTTNHDKIFVWDDVVMVGGQRLKP